MEPFEDGDDGDGGTQTSDSKVPKPRQPWCLFKVLGEEEGVYLVTKLLP